MAVIAGFTVGRIGFQAGYLMKSLALIRRRAAERLAMLCLILLLPVKAQALQWQDLWQTDDQQAQSAFRQQQFTQAAEQFERPDWKAAAQYKAGSYQQAIETLSGANTSDAFYNKGNALANLGQFQEALQAYQQALQLNPDNADAKYNKELIEQELQKQQQQQQQQQQQNDDAKNDSSQQEQKQNQNQDSRNYQAQQRQENQTSQQDDRQNQQSHSEQQEQGSHEQQQADQQQQDSTEQQPEQPQQENPEQQSAEPEQQELRQEDQQPAEQKALQNRQQKEPQDETQQANEQWLKRIPDDPGGLLKRKFAYQYQGRQRSGNSGSEPW